MTKTKHMQIILQRFINREYRLTLQDVYAGTRKKGDKYAEKQAEKYAQAVHDTYVLGQELQQGLSAEVSEGKLQLSQFGEVAARLGLRSLDIINEFQQVTRNLPKGGWGKLPRPTSFTKNAKHRLLEAGAIVDADCGKNAWEITVTLPGSTKEAFEVLAAHTGWIINRLLREITREKCNYWFYVWEWQKRGALHLHFLVAAPMTEVRNIAHCLEYQWWELLWELSKKTQVDLFRRDSRKTWKFDSCKWQSHTAPIQKSVAAYFSKYAGKQSQSKPGFCGNGKRFAPSRWWGCSSHIKKRITQTRTRYSLKTSTSTSKKIMTYLHTMLTDRGQIRRYDYHFDLGKTANGTDLGWGDVCIRFYETDAFNRMQAWEKTIWDGAIAIAHEAGEYDYPTQGWTDADMACRHVLYADMERRHDPHIYSAAPTPTPPPPPHSQPSPLASKLRNARGTQPQATLALRALAVKFLAGGGGVTGIRPAEPPPPPEFVQGELFPVFCKELLRWG